VTAEIAVMNQEAVALAADSAVSGPKIFTSANKIFALSKYHPIAVMVNDSAQFLGVPWETIIKTYRASLGQRSFATLREQAAHFLGFFNRPNPLFPTVAQETCNAALFMRFFSEILEHIDRRLDERTSEGETLELDDIANAAAEIIEEVAEMYLTTDSASPPSTDAHDESISSAYGTIIDRSISSVFEKLPLSPETMTRLGEIAVGLVSAGQANLLSPFHSGVVIAGFGRNEYFPSLYEFELETIALDRLKYVQRDITQIGPQDGRAVVRAFAQREQVATFMTGIDTSVREATTSFWENRLPSLIEAAADRATMDDVSKAKLKEDMTGECEEAINEFNKDLDSLTDEIYVQPIIRVVAMMPKDELAAMAESLVNLTSFKRKVTEEAETVGGPIDVAVISKGDGLVWVKRKHYFAPELNPQFFANYYRTEM
jgi:hypothetical protein